MVVSDNLIYAIETQTNTNIKFIVLSIFLFYSIFLLVLQKKINPKKTTINFYLKTILTIMPMIYIVFAPLMYLFLLNTNISMELFIIAIMGIYLINLGITLGLSLYKGGALLSQMLGYNDSISFKEFIKERNSKIKYG
jgi:hypothetical protein